ncbi:response regulator [Streptomyces sp. NPDC005786]|uniref:response regulator n=1 Tax=Streptomyces sp. NPDC005786 TaxID=3154891 RepID=UPI0033EE19D5
MGAPVPSVLGGFCWWKATGSWWTCSPTYCGTRGTRPSGRRDLHLGLSQRYDVLVLDRRLPALDGLRVLSRLRSRAVRTPLLLLTARKCPR